MPLYIYKYKCKTYCCCCCYHCCYCYRSGIRELSVAATIAYPTDVPAAAALPLGCRVEVVVDTAIPTVEAVAAHCCYRCRLCYYYIEALSPPKVKLMTPGQIILPPSWLHVWECVLKSGSIPSISPPVTGTGDLGDDDFFF